MSFLGRPVIFLPGDNQWDTSRRRQTTGIPRRNSRRRPYPTQMSRYPFEYIFDVDPFDDVYVEDYPEESLYDMRNPPAEYVIPEPRRVYVYKTKTDPECQKPEETMKKKKPKTQTRNVQDSRKVTKQPGTDTKSQNGDPVVMGLDQLVGRLFRSLYGIEGEPRCQLRPDMRTSEEASDQRPETKIKQTSEMKSSQTEPMTNSRSETRKEDRDEKDSKQNEMQQKSDENERKSDDTLPVERNIAIKQEDRSADDKPEEKRSNDIEFVFIVDGNNSGYPVDGILRDESREMSEAEEEQEESNETERELEDASRETTDVVHEPTFGKDLEKSSMRTDEPEKFQMTFDLSSFLPEEIQAKLSDDKLILDAVHEVVKEGLTEKHSVQRVITLPPGVDPDSLRCQLGDDGHMTISANFVEKRKSKIIAIETHTD